MSVKSTLGICGLACSVVGLLAYSAGYSRAENQKEAPRTGYAGLYLDHVLQADRWADFDFLVGGSGAPVGRDNH